MYRPCRETQSNCEQAEKVLNVAVDGQDPSPNFLVAKREDCILRHDVRVRHSSQKGLKGVGFARTSTRKLVHGQDRRCTSDSKVVRAPAVLAFLNRLGSKKVSDAPAINSFPEVPRRNRAIGAPGFSQFLHSCGLRKLPHPEHPLKPFPHTKVPRRKHIRATEGEDKEHVYSPDTYSFDGNKVCDDFLVTHFRKSLGIYHPFKIFLCKIAQIDDFLIRKSRTT